VKTLWVALDVEYQMDPKIIRAGASAELLYVRSLALSKRLMTDGQINAAHLSVLAHGLSGKPANHAATLVTEGLWACSPEGWVIVAWSKRNISRVEIEAKQDAKREAGIKGNHERWHQDRPSETCPYCLASATRNGSHNGSHNGRRRIARTIAPGIASDPSETETETETETEKGRLVASDDPELADRFHREVTHNQTGDKS
jgi:hypothetical protein